MSTYTTPVNETAGADLSSAKVNAQLYENIRYLYDRGGGSVVKLGSDLAATTSTTLANSTGLSFTLASGFYYRFWFGIIFTSATATTGIKIGLTFPSGIFAANVRIPCAADGTDAFVDGTIITSGDSVIGTGVETTSTRYLVTIEGIIVTGAAGALQVQHAAEVGAAGNVIVGQGSMGQLSLIG